MNIEAYRQALPQRSRGTLVVPGDAAYQAATTPRNATAHQAPGVVVLASTAEHVADAVIAAAETGMTVTPQATGHGAAGDLDSRTVLIDTSKLDAVAIDPDRRTARVGAGATFGRIDEAAFRHGLLAPGGTAPDVAVAGYTALGGVGWLTRPHGLASASLLAVEVVDGSGRRIRPGDDRYDEVLWSWRGGGGAGIAVSMELALHPAADLRAGYLLWPAEDAETVMTGWGRAVRDFHPALTTAVGLLDAPDAPTVPERLRGHPVVHLSAATVVGAAGEDSLRRFLATMPTPAIDTVGPCDADRLATIHLDPPAPVPALGEGRWLTEAAADRVHAILTAAGIGADSPLGEVEMRHIASPASAVPGAVTTCPGPLVLHATGGVPDADARDRVRRALGAVVSAAAAADSGFGSTAFRDGRSEAPDALPQQVAQRVAAIRRAVDPADRIQPSRLPTAG